MTAPVLEWFDARLNFKHRVTNRRQTVTPIRLRKEFGFGDASPVGQAEKLHRLTCDLMMCALLDHQAAGCNRFSNEFAEALLAVVKPASVTRTNADGEFTLQVSKKQGRVALLVEASRELDHLEHFVWFVWLDQLTPDGGVYLFSNHNVVGSANDANVVNVPAAPPET